MKEKIDVNLIKKYSEGEYSFKDLKVIANWFSDFRFHSQVRTALKYHWTEFEDEKEVQEKDLSNVFNKLKTQILEKKNQMSTREKITKIYFRVAAIIVLPLLIYSAYTTAERIFFNSNDDTLVEVVSPSATRSHLSLPDGSRVVLNGNSSLKYHTNFNKNRIVELKGEAYFDVAHKFGSRFLVKTENLDVQVLGTKFSVTAFKNDNMVGVILKDGKVKLKGKNNSFSEVLKPNEAFYYNKRNKSGRLKNVDAKRLTAWKDGVLIFRDEPLREVLKKLGRWYDVQFDVKDKKVLNFTYRATFRNESLEEVLRLITLTAPVDYEIKNRNKNSNGIYAKKRILIKLKK